MPNQTITAVPGVQVGHAQVEGGGSGCTVLLGPFRAACDVRGLATGTREIETLAPTHLVPRADAILLTGGSAYGLRAADGVMAWLKEHGRGYETGVARVPIVPGAVIFDLADGRRIPEEATGRAACEAATADPVKQGRVGAGTGATIGKVRGLGYADPGGLGTAALKVGEFTMGALAVCNALGDVLDFDNTIIAGTRNDDGSFTNTLHALAGIHPIAVHAPLTNTTLAVVATDAPLTRTALQALARAASCGIVRRIAPSNTIFDGDVVFAVSTSATIRELEPAELLTLSAAAQLALEHAIISAARAGGKA